MHGFAFLASIGNAAAAIRVRVWSPQPAPRVATAQPARDVWERRRDASLATTSGTRTAYFGGQPLIICDRRD
jgi:hypothetical protein